MDSRERTIAEMVSSVAGKMYDTSAGFAAQVLDEIITDLNIQKKQLQDESKAEHE